MDDNTKHRQNQILEACDQLTDQNVAITMQMLLLELTRLTNKVDEMREQQMQSSKRAANLEHQLMQMRRTKGDNK